MLNNELEKNQAAPAPGARRVTPEEFSAAVIAIQKRRAEEERLLSETVAVDEVVRDLNIDATPEEILAEVEAQRKAKIQPRMPAPPRSSSDRSVPILEQRKSFKPVRSPRYKLFEGMAGFVAATAATIGILAAIFGTNPFHIFGGKVNEPLTSIPVGHHVTITNSELDRLINGGAPSSIYVTDHENLHFSPWTIVNEGGKYYIWAYAVSPLPTDLQHTSITLYNDAGDVPGEDATNLTVPVSSLKGSSVYGDGDDGQITVNKLVLDNHKDDDWTDN